MLDKLAKAVTKIRVGSSFAEADGIVLHPSDFEAAVLSKTTGSGEYMAVSPIGGPAQSLWGLRTILTTDISEGTALVGAFGEAAIMLMRLAPRVETNPYSETSWATNTTVLRCEERIGLAIGRPSCLCVVTGL